MGGKVLYFVILIIFGIAFINSFFSYNEATFEEIQQNVYVVEDGKIDPENEGKLVLVTGRLTCDNRFRIDGLNLDYDSCYIDIEWQKNEDGEWLKNKNIKRSADAKLGDFVLSQEFFDRLGAKKYHEGELAGYTYDDDGGWYYNAAGDLRLKLVTVELNEDYTVLAKQVGDHFEAFHLEDNDVDIERIYRGRVTNMDELSQYFDRSAKGSRIFTGLIFAAILGIGIGSLKRKPTAKTEK